MGVVISGEAIQEMLEHRRRLVRDDVNEKRQRIQKPNHHAAVLLALTGCSAGDLGSGDGGKSTIKLLVPNDATNVATTKAVIAAFEKQYPKYKMDLLPADNEKDLPDIPAEVKESLKFHFVENVDQVLRIALGTATAEKKPARMEKGPKAERNQGVGARAGRY